jgi:hypothetical protein
MNKVGEEHGAPKNTNPTGRRGHGGKINQDQGWVTFIQELISKEESSASGPSCQKIEPMGRDQFSAFYHLESSASNNKR